MHESLLAELISGDPGRAQSALDGLAGQDASIIAPLLKLAESAQGEGRWWAVCALGRSPHARSDHLVPFVHDADPAVRQAALLGLASHAGESAVPALIGALADPDPLAANLAVSALVHAGPAAVPALLTAAEGRPLSMRVLALRALAGIKDQRAIPVMMRAMQGDSALLQHWAQQGLEGLGLDMVYLKP